MSADPNITAKVICDSRNRYGNRLQTQVVTLPRIILAEFNTHRMLSRNSASSRAIPFNKQVNKVLANPFIPVQFGKNEKGMQAYSVVLEREKETARAAWLKARDKAVLQAEVMHDAGVHKQIVNRLIEPWIYTTVIVSATQWHNFFALRAHKDAQPEFQVLAYRMLEAYLASKPKQLEDEEWHIPFGDKMQEETNIYGKLKIATARCARVSYETFDGEININSDFELHDRLAESGHWSPFEHCGQASSGKLRSGNFFGFIQYRDTFPRQCRTSQDTDLELILANKPEWI